MATYPVKYLHSGMRGAPTLNGTAGTLLSVLNACLLDGFGAISITSVSVDAGVATATVSSGDWFEDDSVILIAGATPAALNGEQRVLSHTATTFTFATAAPDGAATGTISVKYAPVGGWEKSYTGTNVAVYRSIDPQANGHFLRVNDSYGGAARVVGYESMSDIDTGVAAFPTESQKSGGGIWQKSQSSSNAGWAVFADSRFIIVCLQPYLNSGAAHTLAPALAFGDPIPIDPSGDAWSTLLAARAKGNAWDGAGSLDVSGYDSTGMGCIAAVRSHSGMGGAVLQSAFPFSRSNNDQYSGSASNSFGSAPSGIDGGLMLSQVYVSDGKSAAGAPRAIVPGLIFVPHSNARTMFASKDILLGTGAYAGRRLIAMTNGPNLSNPSLGGIYFVDSTGPWRD